MGSFRQEVHHEPSELPCPSESPRPIESPCDSRCVIRRAGAGTAAHCRRCRRVNLFRSAAIEPLPSRL